MIALPNLFFFSIFKALIMHMKKWWPVLCRKKAKPNQYKNSRAHQQTGRSCWFLLLPTYTGILQILPINTTTKLCHKVCFLQTIMPASKDQITTDAARIRLSIPCRKGKNWSRELWPRSLVPEESVDRIKRIPFPSNIISEA